MTRTLLRAGALSCALLTSTYLTTPAMAQSTPAYRNLDANGVDLTHGDFVMGLVEGSIGSGNGELALVRDRAWSNGFNGHRWDLVMLNEFVSTRSVSFGTRAEYFTGSTSQQANGSTLTFSSGAYIHRTADGTTTTFAPRDPNCTPSGGSSCFWIPTSIATPDGKATSLSWEEYLLCPDVPIDPENPCTVDSVRISQVANSQGYSIGFTYADPSTGGSSGPMPSWFQRTRADFYNSTAGFSSQAHVTYAYPVVNVTEVTDMGGRVWRISGNSDQITAIRRPDALSDTTTITRSSGQVTSVMRDGVTTGYARSVVGSTATMVVTNALSQQTTIVSDMTIGRPTSVTDALGRTTSHQYDGNGRLTRVTLPEGNYVEYTLDGRGNVTQARQVAKSGSGLADIVTSASYDASCANPVTCNQPNSTTDARGYVTDFTYDSTHGGVLTATAPAPSGSGDRPQTRYTYALSGSEYRLTEVSACSSGTTASPSCVGTANESRTVIGYGGNSNVNSVTRRDGTGALTATTAMTYDALGNLLTVDGPLAGSADTVRTRYNAARQVVGVIGPDPDGGGALKHRATRTTYDSAGRPIWVEPGTVNSPSDGDWAAFVPLQTVTTTYDANSRPVRQVLSGGGSDHAVADLSYDALGRPQCSATRMNPAAWGTLTDACTLQTAGANGPDRIARTAFDAAGQATLVQTGYGVGGVQADEVATTYRNNGQVETVTDAEGNRTTYVYDGHDRLSRTRMPDPSTDGVSSATDYEELGYDAAGNVTSRRLRDGTSIAFTYDRLGRVTEKDLPGSEPTVTYGYDLMGRMTAAATPAYPSMGLSFTFDALGRNLTQVGPLGTASYQYDLAGRRTRLTYPGSGLEVGYAYNVAGDLSEIRENPSGGNVLLATYLWDNLGRRDSITRGNGTTTNYSYDAVSRLSQLVQDLASTGNDLVLGFTHDPASGIATNTRSNDAYAFTGHANQNVTDTVNGLNQVTANGATSISHDARGNISAIGGSGYGYSAENLLTSAPGSVTVAYDPLTRLYEVAGGTTTRFAYDGATLIAEHDGSNALQRRYVHGPGVDEPLVWYEGSGTSTRRYFHADERGSVVAMSDASGNLVGTRNRYDDYGNVQGTLTGRFGYTGQPFMPEFGLYYYRARIYNPTLGRFMQSDPIGYGGGMNLYAYVGGDPVNFADPLGLLCVKQNYSWYSPQGGEPGKPAGAEVKCDGGGGGAGGGASIFARGGGAGPLDGAGGSGGLIGLLDGLFAEPSASWNQGQCTLAGGINVSWVDNRVLLSGSINFFLAPGGWPNVGSAAASPALASTYLNIINARWSSPNVGGFSIFTGMSGGPGGTTGYIGGASGRGGPGTIWFPDLPSPGSVNYQVTANIVAGEFGHGLGLSNQIDRANGTYPHSDGGLMSALHQGPLLGSHVQKIVDQCADAQ